LPSMDKRRNPGPDPRRPAGEGTCPSRTRPAAERGKPRQPECQEHGKRGIAGSVGYDGGKQLKGRKRFLLVDTLGLVWGVLVVSGRCSECEGAKQLLLKVHGQLTRLVLVWMDAGFEHRIEAWIKQHCSFRVEIVKRSHGSSGWELLPKRWVVERTYGWLNRWRG